ncbi:hypothetical protein OsI_04287 [Oryza sativa Indica Group]|uniref:Uncharacterized protein n=1 Tax=Oryza sativa subsp. indica TaxID=39946 RepID=A2WWK6_ORYSI|nr:hypothetical protein OsI_04287 [Oryza sativa Indica Group]
MSVYYETLCPFCSGFVVNDLARIFRDGLSPVVDLRLVPFGNGRVSPDGSITCQHGEEECQLNAIEACVIRLWPDAEQHFPFINCIEHLALTQKWNAWQSCFQETGLASQPVMDCYNSGYGTQLQLQYAAETNALQPPHQFVPWVTVNGRPLGDDYTNFEAYICRAYDGELPEACRGKHLAIAQQTRASRGGKIHKPDRCPCSCNAEESTKVGRSTCLLHRGVVLTSLERHFVEKTQTVQDQMKLTK